MKKHLYIILLAVSVWALNGCRPQSDNLLSYGQNDKQAFGSSYESLAGQFKTLWMAMNENYCMWDYEAECGVDWDEVYINYLPKFEELDNRHTPVSDEELKALYCQFLDSLHDGHMVIEIQNLHTQKLFTISPATNRINRERPQVYADENNMTTLDAYLTEMVDARYRIKDFMGIDSQKIIIQQLDTISQRLIRGSEAYIQAVDEAGGPDSFNDSLYNSVLKMHDIALTLSGYLTAPNIEEILGNLVSQYNEFAKLYSFVAQQVGVYMQSIEMNMSEDPLKFIKFALFEGNIAYLRIGSFHLTEFLEDTKVQRVDPQSICYAYIMMVRQIWSQWFNTIQTLHANGQLGGVIIDVRNNPGGRTDDFQYVLGALLPSGGFQPLYMRLKNGSGRLDFSPIMPLTWKTYPDAHEIIDKEPIVLLANCRSYSLAENSSWAAKCLPNGHLIGTRTFGALSALNTDPATTYSQSYSGAFGIEGQTPIYGYLPKYVFLYPLKDGSLRPLESYGIEPDESVPFDLNLWKTTKRDNQLEKALDYIHKY